MADRERWSLEHDGRTHVVLVEPSRWGRRLTWTLDGELLADKKTSDEKVQLLPGSDAPTDAGALALRFGWVGPARRVTLFEASGDLDASARALVGVGGVDLRPEPGSAAARRQAWILAHPRLHTARQTVVAVAVVVVPILLASLLARFAFSLPWPDWDLPRIPWPDVPWPEIPWPQIPWPDIPWPDIAWPQVPWPDVSLPWWVEEALSYARYVVPAVIAFVLARREIRRHRSSQQTPAGAAATEAPQGGRTAPEASSPAQEDGHGTDDRGARDPGAGAPGPGEPPPTGPRHPDGPSPG